MKDKLIIIGASGHGKVCADIAIKMNKWDKIVFLDDNENLNELLGLKVVGKSNEFKNFINEYEFIVGIGNNKIREKFHKDISDLKGEFATLIHPNSIIGLEVEIDQGCIFMAGTVINCSTKIGEGSIVNTGSTIDHDCIISNFVHVSPGVHVAGTVNIGERTWLGIGCNIINNVNVCDDCIIGAGGVVTKNIEEPGTYFGVPIRRNDEEDINIS